MFEPYKVTATVELYVNALSIKDAEETAGSIIESDLHPFSVEIKEVRQIE